VAWLLKELGLEFETKDYKRDPKTMRAPDSLKSVHPLGLAPILEDGQVKLAETGAIFQYLLDKYDVEGKLHPLPGTEKYYDYIYWLHFSEGTLMPPLLIRLLLSKVVEKVPVFIKPFAIAISKGIEAAYVGDQIKRLFTFMNERLGENPYFLGSELSAVDIMMSFPLEASQERVNLELYPNIKSFLKAIEKVSS
tara:strand:- start:376 stop:957 length:582 start_codon:yes stop_codon:yes gene_type:complete